MARQEFTTKELASEEWRPVADYHLKTPNYEIHYEVSNLGRVRSTRVMMLTPCLHLNYLRVTVRRQGHTRHKCAMIHHLVADAFIGKRPPGFVVNHKDLVRHNNRPSNLEYCTQKENVHHAIANGHTPTRGVNNGNTTHGEAHHKAKLTDKKVTQILLRLARGDNYRQIGRDYAMHHTTIGSINRNEIWKHIPRLV